MRPVLELRVPAGAALAVDRDRFAEAVTRALIDHPLITIVREEITSIPETTGREPVIVATGPLTSDALSSDIAALVGADHLYFYDAISPIVLADTIDMRKVFRASRWGRSLRGTGVTASPGSAPADLSHPGGDPAQPPGVACGVDDGEGDY